MKYFMGVIIAALGLFVLLSGCISAKNIADVKSDEYLDKKVTVSGTVLSTTKIGGLSGYTLQDDSGTVFVSAKKLPEEGSKKRVSGTVKTVLGIGYYIDTN